ncbi:MAG: UDP-N-acetylglucosamine--N-acetylmuramyl-(pentapeptide) pyrophosphoryl-undecaprenol N-acetylglucosamine transferase [Firmicutes bacterium]|nr:UDP-N-acetylglucosamine--N-acetylmuramyl-(pentapeptide) pyrophosphoryl-undecaprenol N-acetylglucosamine transferase [Bacillota bacterium]
MKVVISGGGTGGHLYPALAIGRAYAAKGAEILYVGSEFGIEKNIMPSQEFQYKLLPVKGFGSKNPVTLVKNACLVRKSTAMAKKIIGEFQPDLIVGTGGYASYPVLRAGVALGVKTLLHEANAVLGKANKRLAAMADCLCVTYADTAEGVKANKVLVTGMPVRESIKDATRDMGAEYVGIDDDTLLVTVTGGSQGSHHINVALADYYKQYEDNGKVLFYHIVGKLNKDDAELVKYPFVRVKEYEEQMDKVLARTDICVGRAGASFLAEIAVRGVPTVLVPYPFSGGHQEKNAAYYDKCGAAKMVLDGDLAEKMKPTLDEMIADAELRERIGKRMAVEAKPEALEVIVDAGLELIG